MNYFYLWRDCVGECVCIFQESLWCRASAGLCVGGRQLRWHIWSYGKDREQWRYQGNFMAELSLLYLRIWSDSRSKTLAFPQRETLLLLLNKNLTASAFHQNRSCAELLMANLLQVIRMQSISLTWQKMSAEEQVSVITS